MTNKHDQAQAALLEAIEHHARKALNKEGDEQYYAKVAAELARAYALVAKPEGRS